MCHRCAIDHYPLSPTNTWPSVKCRLCFCVFLWDTWTLYVGLLVSQTPPSCIPGEVDAQEVDLLLVTHFHLDHIASLPYFTEKTTFKGKVFATHPTKAVAKMILSDFIRVTSGRNEDEVGACSHRQSAKTHGYMVSVHTHVASPPPALTPRIEGLSAPAESSS